MSITDSLSHLFISFEFWRFYCFAIIVVIAIHTLINLLIDNVFASTRWIHIGLFLLIVAPLAFGLSGFYFNPFASKTSSPKVSLVESQNPLKKVEKALPEITIISNTKPTGESKPVRDEGISATMPTSDATQASDATPASDTKPTETQLPPSTTSDADVYAELVREFRDAIK